MEERWFSGAGNYLMAKSFQTGKEFLQWYYERWEHYIIFYGILKDELLVIYRGDERDLEEINELMKEKGVRMI
jgi:hypothetical protein